MFPYINDCVNEEYNIHPTMGTAALFAYIPQKELNILYGKTVILKGFKKHCMTPYRT